MNNASINAVAITPLKLLENEHGHLMEVQRRDEEGFPGFGQTYVTQSFRGVIKAWYCHRNQIDQMAVISGFLKLVLYDGRPDSSSFGTVEEIEMGGSNPKLV